MVDFEFEGLTGFPHHNRTVYADLPKTNASKFSINAGELRFDGFFAYGIQPAEKAFLEQFEH